MEGETQSGRLASKRKVGGHFLVRWRMKGQNCNGREITYKT